VDQAVADRHDGREDDILGADVIIFKIFSPKRMKMTFLLIILLVSAKID
jgi:hypothetical protein